MTFEIDEIVNQATIEGLDSLHQDALNAWYATELLRRVMASIDPHFQKMRVRDVAKLAGLHTQGESTLPLLGKESGDGAHPDLPDLFSKEAKQLMGELRKSPLQWIADPTSDDVEFGTDPLALSQLFVSYSHADKRFANRLCEDLRKRGFSIWQDDRDLRVGDSLAESIRDAIDSADYVLSIVSPSSIKSPWVRRELDVALDAELKGGVKSVLPIRRGSVDMPSLLPGKVYADFAPGRYAPALKRLLTTLDWDIDQVPVILGSILKLKAIDGVFGFLNGHGWSKARAWTPTPIQAEVTAGYLSYLRGKRDSKGGEPASFPPHSPVALIQDVPVLTGKGVQLGFSQVRRETTQADILETDYGVMQFPNWKYLLLIAGPAKYVQATAALLKLCPNLNAGAVDDLDDALKWWKNPRIPQGDPVTVGSTPIFPGIFTKDEKSQESDST